MTHEIRLRGYEAAVPESCTRRTLTLGTWGSYGAERLHLTADENWDGLAVTVTFHPPGGQPVQVLADPDGFAAVPPEATAAPTQGLPGRIVVSGAAEGIRRISTDLQYQVLPHAGASGAESRPAPDLWEQWVAAFPAGGTAGQVLAKQSGADRDVAWLTPAGGAIPDALAAEADRAAGVVLQHQNGHTVSLLALADLHCGYYADPGNNAVRAAAQAAQRLGGLAFLDLAVFLGDYSAGAPDTAKADAFAQLDACKALFAPFTAAQPSLWVPGNHDDAPYQSTDGRLTKAELFARIGLQNRRLPVATDPADPAGGYGYLDLESKRLRVIYLNTDDKDGWHSAAAADGGDSSYLNAHNIGGAQLAFLAGAALDLTGKADPAAWGIVVLSHVALNVSGSYSDSVTGQALAHSTANAAALLLAYQTGAAGSITHNGTVIAYDFSTAARGEVLCCIHGHGHCYSSERLPGGILSVGVPNAMNGLEQPSEDGALYTKTEAAAQSTSFCVVTIDRAARVIYADHCGAGYDRRWEYSPAQPEEYRNQVAFATDFDGSLYNGVGYQNDSRISSGGNVTAYSRFVTTGFIPYRFGDLLRVRGGAFTEYGSMLALYDETHTQTAIFDYSKLTSAGYGSGAVTENGFTWSSAGATVSGIDDTVRYLRFSCRGVGESLIATINQPIPENAAA